MTRITNLTLAVVTAAALVASARTSEAGKPVGGGTSPDPRIAYTLSSDLCVANADGTNQRIVVAGAGSLCDPSWSPDGARIAFTSSIDGSGLYVVNADGTGRTKILSGSAYDPHWSPVAAADGSEKILFNSGSTYSDLFAVNPDGSGLVQLTNTSTRSETYASWSPDATKIVVGIGGTGTVLPRSIATFDVVLSGGSLALSNETTVVPEGVGFFNIGFIEWSRTEPNGTGTGFLAAFSAAATDGGQRQLHTVNLATLAVTHVTASTSYEYVMPVWSPDDAKLACRRGGRKASEDGIVTMNRDGSGVTSLDIRGGNQPDWRR